MDTRVRTGLRTTKTPPPKQQQIDRAKVKEKEKIEMPQRNGEKMEAGKISRTSRSRKERRIALQQEVDKLKKKLRHEENVHRALERAFSRPLGSLPRLPPYLPRYTLELLAEVAVLEEEVVRLEEQVVDLRQGLYQEAIYVLSSKKTDDNASDLTSNSDAQSPPVQNGRSPNGKKSLNKPSSCSPVAKEQSGKENHLDSHSSKTTNTKQSPNKKSETNRTSGFKKQVVDKQWNYKGSAKKNMADVTVNGVGGSPNRISEDTLKCLLGIFSQKTSLERTGTEPESTPSTSGCDEDLTFQDPYNICSQFGRRDVGPYKSFLSIDENSIDQSLIADSPLLLRRLKLLLKKLEMVDLRGLNHSQKLAFWINIYNSCMMNAILENGIPSSPQMVAALMPKATIKVGGHLFSAMTIEHFMLRLPYQSKEAFPKGYRNNQMIARSVLGLDWPEPMVTFALSCGSWSSPAVRVYTPSQVENELETAKRDYLQAAVGISATNNLAIPKLLNWYLHDFAKDVESLMDWICLQLPSGLRNDAVMCIERARRGAVHMQNVPVLPYDFRFRYIFAL